MTRDTTQVPDDRQLLDMLIADSAAAPEMHRPTPYWQGYAQRIVAELHRSGLRDFRSNQAVLKGFGSGGAARPSLPQHAVKRAVWHGLAGLPGVSQIIREYERLLRGVGQQLRHSQVMFARQVLGQIAARFPELRVPDGVDRGGPDDAFEWNGHRVTSDWVRHLARAADFYARVPPSQVKGLLEIGPGLGLSTLAHVALNPHLRTVVNIDIVPVLYVSTRFLASSSSLRVVDYAAVRAAGRIDLATADVAADDRPTVWSLPAWRLADVDGALDFAFNAYSFQEMEEDVCLFYAGEIKRLVSGGVQLYNGVEGHAPGAGGQRKPVTLAFLKACFASKFPSAEPLEGFWTGAYEHTSEETMLLRP